MQRGEGAVEREEMGQEKCCFHKVDRAAKQKAEQKIGCSPLLTFWRKQMCCERNGQCQTRLTCSSTGQKRLTGRTDSLLVQQAKKTYTKGVAKGGTEKKEKILEQGRRCTSVFDSVARSN